LLRIINAVSLEVILGLALFIGAGKKKIGSWLCFCSRSFLLFRPVMFYIGGKIRACGCTVIVLLQLPVQSNFVKDLTSAGF
jgi:hypothetical protein